MSQDIVSDVLNQIMNSRRAGKKELVVKAHSKLLLSVLAIAKLHGYIKSYEVSGTSLKITIARINGCSAIKPRFMVQVGEIEKYQKRYLPMKNIGILIVSTSQGLMTHQTAIEKNIGGSLIAYIY